MTGPWSADALVRAHAEAAGAELAILDGPSAWTWARLDAAIEAAAGDLARAGVPAGAIVALLGEPSPPAIASLLAIRRVGAVAAPLPVGLTGPELAAIAAWLRPSIVIHDRAGAGSAGALGVRGLSLAPPEADPPPVARASAPPLGDGAGPAVVVLTSGTTGSPRGVRLSDGALAASADAWLAVLPPATGWILALGLGHVAGLGVLWRAIASRVPVHIVPRSDPKALIAALRASPPPSHVSLVPTQLTRLLDAADDGPPPSTLRAVPLGGGPVEAGLVRRAIRAGWPVVPTYGLSEAGSGVTALPTEEAGLAPGSAGRPLPGVRVWIEEPDADGVGEILVTSQAGFDGYVGEPPRHREAPIHTGDLGRLDGSGRLVVVDRRTDRVVRGGENIAPAEVEAILVEHPAVADAAVVGRPDPLWGQVPVGAIVLDPDAPDPGDEALLAHCRRSLAGFKVPVAFLRLDALPRTGGGKVRRAALRALVDGSRAGELARPGGDAIGWRVTGTGALPVLLLHGTLSTAAQLDRLAAELARRGDVVVHALDRRGSGTGRTAAGPAPLDIALHVADLVAYLDARGIRAAALVGISFGGGLALEMAARHPTRVAAVAAFEPPYGPVATEAIRRGFAELAGVVEDAHRTGGAPAAAEAFLRAAGGDEAWDRLPPRTRAFLEGQGDGALADAGLTGLDPDGLAGITAPVTILSGGASEPWYASIADALVERIPGARRVTLDGLAHPSPITQPAAVAAAVRACLELPA